MSSRSISRLPVPRRLGIYEGAFVKPERCRFCGEEVFCNILVAFGVGRSALISDPSPWQGDVPFFATSSEPEAEGDPRPSLLPHSSSWGRRGVYAQASIRDRSGRNVAT